MKFLKGFIFRTALVSSVLIFSVSSPALAMTYKDVPSSHWAFSAVDSVSNKGIMGGDLSGNFKPDDYIDKFETSKILAKIAGYKYTGATAEEQLYYDRCSESNKAFINQYANKFKKWNSTYNKEIAFLLEKEILVPEDLNQFVVIVNNEERLRALSREEACMFLVKATGKSAEANKTSPSNLFKDDSSINANYRKYVYYFRNQGIVKGDNNNNFNPKSAITKAAASVIIDSAMGYEKAPTQSTSTSNNTGSNTVSNNNTSNVNIETVQGTVAKLYPTARAIQVSSANDKYNNKIYIVSSTATININDFVKTYADLKEGMGFVGVFSGNELISVTATSVSNTTPQNTTPQVPTPTQPPVNNTPAAQIKAEGTISGTKSDTTGNYIDFETRNISPRGEITSDVKTYLIDKTATITRGGVSVNFTSVVKGDIANIMYSGNTVSKIELEEKDRTFTGTLKDKTYNERTGIPVYVISDSKGNTYNFTVTNATEITRKGSGSVNWNELRIGDTVDVKSEYETLKSINAYGTKSTVDAWVNAIFISQNVAKVTVKDANNKEKEYSIISGTTDPYTLRVGSKIRLRLDSDEVESFSVLEDSKAANISGVITNITRTNIIVKDTTSAYAITKEFKYDSNTVVIDSITGKTVSSNYLDTDMKVFVVFSDSNSGYAKTITILGY